MSRLIAKTDVTYALGYSPYDASNPLGFSTLVQMTNALTGYATLTNVAAQIAAVQARFPVFPLLATVATSGLSSDLSGPFTLPVRVSVSLTGSAAASGQSIVVDAAGSGTNGPTTAQAGLRVNLTKRNWFAGGATVGEIDGAYITVRQGGAGSDAAGLLLDVQNTGTGFLAGIEMQVTAVDTVANVLTRDIDVQIGVLDGVNHGYYGQVLSVAKGMMTSALLVQSAPGAGWTAVLQAAKSGVMQTVLDDSGNLDLNGNLRAGRGLANSLRLQGAVSGAGPAMTVEGTDANISLVMQPKGAGQTYIGSGLQVLGVSSLGTDKANFVTVGGSAVGFGPVISAIGTDPDVSLVLTGKGTGSVFVASALAALLAGTVKTLDVGAPDSGGVGYRMVRVAN